MNIRSGSALPLLRTLTGGTITSSSSIWRIPALSPLANSSRLYSHTASSTSSHREPSRILRSAEFRRQRVHSGKQLSSRSLHFDSPQPSKLAWAFPALTIPSLPEVDTLSHILLEHPIPYIGYAGTIIVLTLLVRTVFTLPITIWSRKRINRMTEIVRPEMKVINDRLAIEVMKESKKMGLNYEQYKARLKDQLATEQSRLVKEHNCHPLATALLPPLIHIPIFLLLSFTIRRAVILPNTGQPYIPPTVISDEVDGITAVLDTTTYPFANEAFLWCPALSEVDPLMVLPFAVGLLAFTNVEVMQVWRKYISTDSASASASQTQSTPPSPLTKPPSSTRPPPPRTQRIVDRAGKTIGYKEIPQTIQKQKQKTSVKAMLQDETASGNMSPEELAKRELAKRKEGMRERIIGNVLRIFSVVSVGIAAELPAAVVLYWLTSTGYTLVQNILLGWTDRGRSMTKIVKQPPSKVTG